MSLSVMAELRPVFDSGTLRTLVQLLDTNVVMESGAFPPSWSFFVQDLIKGLAKLAFYCCKFIISMMKQLFLSAKRNYNC